VTEVHIAHSR